MEILGYWLTEEILFYKTWSTCFYVVSTQFLNIFCLKSVYFKKKKLVISMHLSISGEDFRTFISESFFSSAVPFCGTHSHRGRFSGHDNLNLLQSRVKAYLSPIFTIFCTRYQVVFHLYHTYHLLLLISLLPSNMSSSIVLHWVNSSITNNFCVTRTVITYYISHLTPLNSCPA